MKKYSIICMWDGYDYNNNYFTNILNNYHKLSDVNDNIDFLIIGPFINNEYYNIIKNKVCIKILYITEPIEVYYDLCYDLYKNKIFNYITGCTINKRIKSTKFPLYLIYFSMENKNIFNNTNCYVKNCSLDKKFCTLIFNHDRWNTRTSIYNKLINISEITCPSKLFNNCSNEELNSVGNIEYIKKFLFNICSENILTTIDGYITEKLLNCCLAGSIPIYCGWIDKVDEKIFNKKRILIYNPNNKRSLNIIYKKIKLLMENKEKLNDFYRMDVFKKDAYMVCKKMHNKLLKKLINI